MNIQTICFAAGKSGGHIIPCLTIARQQYPDHRVLFFSTNAPLDKKIIEHAQIAHHSILPLGNVRYTTWYHYPVIAWQLGRSFIEALYQLIKHRPVKIISTGGLVALPVCIAGYILRIPIELFELNVQPGKALKALIPFAHHTYICFADAQKNLPTATLTDYPVRFATAAMHMTRHHARTHLGLQQDTKTIFIIGGSQGSIFLNNVIQQWILTNKPTCQIIHQTGTHDTTDWHAWYAQHNIPAIVFEYRDDLAPCYAAADVVITRAGAGTLFEVLFFGKKQIIIPLEAHTTAHQVDNAYALACMHPDLCTVLRQKEIELNPHNLFNKLAQ